ncbi:ribonuclease HI family protein [Pelagirhabdus alkalitolerans]|nr:ribonuclease HI family protein [Pelagirhabdus alkalitolerans]
MLAIYTDAASSGNPGPTGISFVIKQNGHFIEYYKYIGDAVSNHDGEFYALMSALDYCKEHFPNDILSIRSDSKLVVDAVNRQYVKQDHFRHLLEMVLTKMDPFPHCFIKWIPEKQNSHADRLAKKALLTKSELISQSPSV